MKLLLCCNVALGYVKNIGPFYCPESKKVCDNIIKLSEEVDVTLFINDEHIPCDPEFDYLPPHMIEGDHDCLRIYTIERRIKSEFYFLRKNFLSAIKSQHNRDIYMGMCPTTTILGGFLCSYDILATAMDVIQSNHKVEIYKDACGDVDAATKERAIGILGWMGIPIL